MKKTEERLAAETRISEWRELKKAVEAMEFEKFLHKECVSLGTQAIELCWANYETMRTDTALKKDKIFIDAGLDKIKKLIDYDYPDWVKKTPFPILLCFGNDTWSSVNTSAFHYDFVIDNVEYSLCSILKNYSNRYNDWFAIRAGKTNKFYSFFIEALPFFLQKLDISASVYQAYCRRGANENVVLSDAENLLSRLKLVANYIEKSALSGLPQKMGFKSLVDFLNQSKITGKYWVNKNVKESEEQILALRQTLTTLPIKEFEVF
jgi:hypothetical protein